MNGKVLKVKQTSLEFGGHDRFVNVLGCWRHVFTQFRVCRCLPTSIASNRGR